jgi:hypothetical protein
MAFSLKQIVAWSSATIPSGWAICNGQTVNSIVTPDLRSKFILGAANDTELGTTTGASTHTHAMPAATGSSAAHNHTLSLGYGGSGTDGNKGYGGSGATNAPPHTPGGSQTVDNNTSFHTHTTSTTGTGTNIPAYIKLLFIMKVG